LDYNIDKIIVVDIDEKQQIQRTMERDKISEQQAKDILSSQMSRQERLKLADYVIDNSKDLPSMHKKIDTILNKLK
jgi:dephospho-CoA kinase